jgi:protein-disulfide isomerase
MPKSERIRLLLDVVGTLALVVTAAVLVRATLVRQSEAAGGPSVGGAPNLLETVDLDVTLTGHIAGSKEAKLAIVEFSDFQCPYCERFARETFPQLKRDFIETGIARFSYRNNPLGIHPFAMKASTAAECADEQGKYWEMHDAIFSHQRQLGDAIFVDQAKALRMNVDTFSRCLASDAPGRIQADQSEASRLGVQSTPVFLIGRVDSRGAIKATKRINGAAPYETFKTAIKALS